MASRKANRGIVVTYGSFTQDAKEFAHCKPLDLVDGQKLMALIERVQKNHKTDKVISISEQKNYKTDQAAMINEQRNNKTKQATGISKVCPLCGSEMVLRKAKTGKYAGQQFWGCKSFPKCRSISRF
jgi:restriction system protein